MYMDLTDQALLDLHDALEEAIEERAHCLTRDDVMTNFDDEKAAAMGAQLDRWVALRDAIAPEIAQDLQERDQ